MAVLKEELTRPPASVPRNGAGGRMVLPKDFVPGPNCVICGRGKACSSNPGNKRLKEVIDAHLKEYSEAKSKVEKSAIVSKIVETIKQSSPDGAFVKFEQGVWYEVEEAVSREKIGSMLRDLLHTQYRSSSKAKLARRKANRAHHMMMMPADPNWLANNLQRNLMLSSGGLDYSNHSLDFSNHTQHTQSTSLDYSSSSLNFSNHGLDYSNHSHRNGLDYSNHSTSRNMSNHSGLNMSNHAVRRGSLDLSNLSSHGVHRGSLALSNHRNSLDFSNHSNCSNLDYSNHGSLHGSFSCLDTSNHGSSTLCAGGVPTNQAAAINNDLNSSVHSACSSSYGNHGINAPVFVQDEVPSFQMMSPGGRLEPNSQAPCSPSPIAASNQQQQKMSGFSSPMPASCISPGNMQEQQQRKPPPPSRASMLRSLLPMSEHLGITGGSSGKDVPPTKERVKPRSALERILEHGYEFISTSARSLLIRDDDEDDIPQINMSSNSNNNAAASASFVDTTTTAASDSSCLPPQQRGNSSAAAAAALAPVDGGDEVLPPEFYSLFGGCAMGK